MYSPICLCWRILIRLPLPFLNFHILLLRFFFKFAQFLEVHLIENRAHFLFELTVVFFRLGRPKNNDGKTVKSTYLYFSFRIVCVQRNLFDNLGGGHIKHFFLPTILIDVVYQIKSLVLKDGASIPLQIVHQFANPKILISFILC